MFNVKRCARKSKQNPNAYSVQELKEMAKKLLIKGYSTMTKEQLCKEIAKVTNKGKNIQNNVEANNNNKNNKNNKNKNNNAKIQYPKKIKIVPNEYHIVASRVCSTLENRDLVTYQDLIDDGVLSNQFSPKHFNSIIVFNSSQQYYDVIKAQIDKVIANGLIRDWQNNGEYEITDKGLDYLDSIKDFNMVSKYGVDLEF